MKAMPIPRGVAALALFVVLRAAAVTVDANLPAGNIVFERIDGSDVYVHQDLRDTPKPWFYWAMRVSGAAGRTLTFHFTQSPAVGLRGPCVSLDRGRTFSFAAEKDATRKSFTYAFPSGADEVWFYANEPYMPADWQAFVDAHRDSSGKWFVVEPLAQSRKGRPVPRARFGCIGKAPRYRVFACARHHCGETMGSFVLEGLAAAFLAKDELGDWLRANVELLVVPFVDMDGVVDGDQGKNRAPHDHNRDYVKFIYPETKAIADWLTSGDVGRVDAFFDFHCPTYANKFGYSPRSVPNLVREVGAEARFSELLEKLQTGGMRYRAANDLMPGQGHNKGDRIGRSSAWASRNLKEVRLVRVTEVPFAESNGAVVNGDLCRRFGGDMAKALRAFFTDAGEGPRPARQQRKTQAGSDDVPSLRWFRAPVEKSAENVKGILLLEAEGFADYGKWRLDTQFVHKMGSACLIAAGVGKPLDPAVTTVAIPRAGRWTVWARCNDWHPPHSPGKFAVSVGGKEGKVLGASGTRGWRWEKSGEVDLPAGETEVKLVDKTGWFARCDAVILAEGGEYTPPDAAEELERERLRLKGQPAEPEECGEWDVVVVGAGTTGMGACVAAARMGAKTALIQDRPVLGGNASAELGVGIHGASHAHPNSRETGLIEEAKLIRSRMFRENAKATISSAYLEQARGERRLKVFLNNRVVKVEMGAKGVISSVVALDTLTGRRKRYRAKVFIDTTGDGWIGYYAGVPYRFGREGQEEFGEAEAPEKPDRTTMSGVVITDRTWCFGYHDTGRAVKYETPPWAKDALPEGWTRKYPPKIKTRGGFGPSWKVEHPGIVDDFEDPEYARDELVRLAFAYFGWGKNEWEHRGLLANYALTWVPYIDARRETLRLVGDYTLTGNDQKEAKVFPDRISYGGWPMDTHDPLGFANPVGNGYWKNHPDLPIYTIPYRILYNPGFGNLLFAGRCSSTSHMGLGSLRLEATLATLGQVCGTAAALCVKYGETPKQIGEKRIKELQQRLLREDMYIPGLKNEDRRDVARKAKVTASSSQDRIWFAASSSVSWHIAQSGIGFKNKRDPKRAGWCYAEGAKPEAVIDGVSRIVENDAHGWVSDASAELPQTLMLEWPKPIRVRHVRITFNSDLMPTQPAAMPAQLVKSYAVEGRSGGKWEEIVSDTENWRRLAMHWFESREIDALRIVCKETWGDRSAQIFEVRVY